MSYQALYRVWRPQSFDELMGQNMVAQTLKNAVQYKQLSHAYLFTGPRGTGKTSMAKILAKAVNCPNQTDGNPCNQCEICQAITSGQAPDVIEIDAASNNGVEEIRDLRDKVRYAPTVAKNKVYIIDEVHMLTTGAFNALLKTLEEPPENVIFILATTEPHKVLPTIVSRTQRFDFQKIADQVIIERMIEILITNQVAYDDQALAIIARAANGGLRDSLSLLDQALSLNAQEVTLETALEVSGSVSQILLANYLVDVYEAEGVKALDLVRQSLAKGKQTSRFIEELIIFVRDLLLAKQMDHDLGQVDDQALQSHLKTINSDFLFKLIDKLTVIQSQLRYSNQPDIYLEMATIQLAQVKNDVGTDFTDNRLVTRIEQLEAKIKDLELQLQEAVQGQEGESNRPFEQEVASQPPVQATLQTGLPPQGKPRQRPDSLQQTKKTNLNNVYAVLDNATRIHAERIKQLWTYILTFLSPQDRAKLNQSKPLAAGPGLVLVSLQSEVYGPMVQNDDHLMRQLMVICDRELQEQTYIVFILEQEWLSIRQTYKAMRDENNGQSLGYALQEEISRDQHVIGSETSLADRESQLDEPLQSITEVFEKQKSMNQAVDNQMNDTESVQAPQETSDELKFEAATSQEQEPAPLLVSKALELFGEDLVSIDPD